MKRVFFFCLLCLGLSPAALAMPGMSGDRFAAADSDKDGFLSREEFAAAFPSLKKEAFAIIDADKDGRVSREEWQAFSGGHGKNTGQGDGGMSGQAGGTGGGLPLLPIPGQNGGAAAPQTPPSGREAAPSLPLLTPPGK